MQTLLAERTDNRSMLARGASMLGYNKRYIFWFYVLNLTLGAFGTAAFRNQVHPILDHSLRSGRLVYHFDLAAFFELLARPEFGPMKAATMSAMYFVMLYFAATALFLPGVIQGFASTYRLPREDFFRACGRNLWRFIRVMIIAAIVMGIVAGALFGAQGWLVKKAGESTNELLPFSVEMTVLAIIFLVMTWLRIWFDVAEVDVVLNDQRAVRRSIRAAFGNTRKNLVGLLGSYVFIAVVAGLILLAGLFIWERFVAAANVRGAFLVGQITLLLLLIPRFWQRGVAVAYWQRKMLMPVVAVEPVPERAAVAEPGQPVVSPVIPSGQAAPSGN